MNTQPTTRSRFSLRHVLFAAALACLVGTTQVRAQYQVPGLGNSTGSKLTVAEARTVAQMHDDARRDVGITTKLKWSNELASVAQAWADHLIATNSFKHRPNNKYGENIFGGVQGFHTVATAVNGWESEKKDYRGEAISTTNYQVFGHYTQMIWQNTTSIGCGQAFDPRTKRLIVVCNYDPAGNMIGQKPVTKNTVVEPVQPVKPVQPAKPAQNEKKVVARMANRLSNASPVNKHGGDRYYALSTYNWNEGEVYELNMTADFEPWLLVLDSQGKPVASAYGQGSTPARMGIRVPKTGKYYVFATTKQVQATGNYQVNILE